MSETFEFRVTYDERIVRPAISAFIFHALGGRLPSLVAFVLGSASAIYLISFGIDSRFAGFVTGSVLCSLAFAIWLVVAYRSQTIGAIVE